MRATRRTAPVTDPNQSSQRGSRGNWRQSGGGAFPIAAIVTRAETSLLRAQRDLDQARVKTLGLSHVQEVFFDEAT